MNVSEEKSPKSKSGTGASMEETFKKATSELLVLKLLSEQDRHINDILAQMNERSKGTYKIAFPYALLYRLEKYGYLEEAGKRIADDRRRQFYRITDSGREYLKGLLENYRNLTNGIELILNSK